MAIKLKQSTASQEIPLGYFVDDDDGNTEMTGLTIANTDIKLWKTGATTLANKNSGGATHIANGIYYCVLDATDTNTLGSMVVFVHVAGALACRVECEVLAANVYDSLVGGGDLLDVNASQVGGQTASAAGTVTFPGTIASTTNITAGTVTTATNVTTVNGLANNVITANSINADAITNAKIADNAFGPEQFTATMLARFGVIGSGTAQSASSTGVVLASADAYADDVLIGCTILVFGSTQGYWQSRLITDNALSGDTVTVDTWQVTPSGTITYIIIGTPKASSTAPVPASLSSTELAKFFLTDTGETYGDAVAGSVVKEIADNAGGSSLTVQDIVDGVWDEARSAHTDSGSFGQGVASVQGNVTGSVASVSGAVGSVTGAVGSVTGAVGSVTGNVGGTVNGLTSTAQGHVRTAVGLASANLDTQLSTIDSEVGTIDTVVDAIKVTTDKLDDTLEDQGGGTYGFTEAALQEAPSGGGGGDATEAKQDAIIALIGTPAADLAADIAAVKSDTQNIQSRIPAALVSGRMNSNVAAINDIGIDGEGVEGDPFVPEA